MQAIYVPKYKIYYRVSPKEPNVLQWSNKPFGPATQWQTAMRFGKPIRALDTDDKTGQGVVVLNDSSTYVSSGVRVWGRKFYPAGTRIYSLYAIGESKMKPKLKIKIHESKKNETFASMDDIEKIENYLRPRMVGNTYGKNSLSPENDVQQEINKLFRESDFHTLDGAEEDDLCFNVSFIRSDDIDDDDLPKGTNKAYFYEYATDAFLLFTVIVYVEDHETYDGVKVTGLYAENGD